MKEKSRTYNSITRPEYHIHVREALYLDNTLDLF